MRIKSNASLLALFLGGIGAHRFYLGQTGLGFLYLLFCWTFIPFIVSIIDFILLLKQDEKKFNAIYNVSISSIPQIVIPDICPHCKNPNTSKIRMCEWCGNQTI